MKHFILCIKKKAVKQKEIENLFALAVVNFQCSDVEFNIVNLSLNYNNMLQID